MPSSADPLEAALARAASLVHDAIAALDPAGPPPIVLIDGRSGAGKTTLAARLREGWSGEVGVIGLDEIYPGWDGLAEGAEIVRASILEPLTGGREARWRRWDWARSRPGAEVVTPPGTPLIIEGSGVLTPASAALAPVRVWLEAPADTRRERALARDGDTYRPHWDRWAVQEERHLRRDDPRSLATIVVDVP
ncbi:MAG: hypothetical protein DI566_05945 [Microbacterium sp.]|nr:MAG: hypothetical protein DI566_05945 [Microbacterium sp.]